MALLSTTVDLLIQTGAEVSVSAKDYPFTFLGTFLTSAIKAETKLTIRDASALPTTVLQALAREGTRSVRFEF